MVDKDIFKELEKLAPQERIKRLKEIEESIEKEKQEQLKAAKDLLEKSNEEMEQESEERKLETMFEHIKDEESLEEAVKKEESENIEGHVQYTPPTDEAHDQIERMYERNEVEYKKKDEVAGSYQSGIFDAAKQDLKNLGYDPIRR
ncbi:hypothetical protein KY328_02900 [Candidatus Woesearchaeota archaeon]|nr:hypothetical protein [Candidatus Woesearchaeota archaeon]